MRSSYIICSTVIFLLLWMRTEIALEASKIKNGVEILMKFYQPCISRGNSTDCLRRKTLVEPEHIFKADFPSPFSEFTPNMNFTDQNFNASKSSGVSVTKTGKDSSLFRLFYKLFGLFPMRIEPSIFPTSITARSSHQTFDQNLEKNSTISKAKKVQKDSAEYAEDSNYSEEDMQYEPEHGHDTSEVGEDEDTEMEDPEEESDEDDEEEESGNGYMGPIAMNVGAILTKPSPMESQGNHGNQGPGAVSLKKEPASMMQMMNMRPMQMMPMMGGSQGGDMMTPLKHGQEDEGGGESSMMPMMVMMMPSPDSSGMDKHKHKHKDKKKKKKKKKKKHKKKKEGMAGMMMDDKMDGAGGEGGAMMPDPSTMMKMGMVGVGGMVLLVLKAITLVSGKAVLASTIALTLSVIMALKALFNSAHAQQSEGSDKVMTYMKKPIHINADSSYPDYRNYHGSDWSYYDSSYFPTKKSGKLPDVKVEKFRRTDAPVTKTLSTTGSPVNPFEYNPETYSSANIINYKSRPNNSGISQFHAHSVPLYAGYSPLNT